MSKITPKNLHYDTTLPPFLARLQANNGSRDGRQEFQAARPKKPRNSEEEAEDEPVYFDERTGDSLTRTEWEEREKLEGGGDVEGRSREDGDEAVEGVRSKAQKEGDNEKVAAIGGSKKRKAGKIIGAAEDTTTTAAAAAEDGKTVLKPEKQKAETGKSSKKQKKIMLSFGDDE